MADSPLPLDAARPVRDPLDVERLGDWLAAHGIAGPLSAEQFPGGFSNLTYLVRAGDGPGARELVLRRPPVGAQVKGGHDMAREHRLLARLADHYPWSPRPVILCDDATVIGAPFYLMERVRGVVLRGHVPAALAPPPATMRALSERLVDHLAALHAIDPQAAGLDALGRAEGYVERQVRGWSERWVRARGDDAEGAVLTVPAMDRLAAWLEAHRPAESGASIIHGDFKYDNVVLDPTDPTRIVAVLDWEMATLGDPLMDLGTTLAYWFDPDDPADLVPTALRGPTTLPGNLSRAEVVQRYTKASGRTVGGGGGVFYYAFGLFKLGVIAGQIFARYRRGLTTDPRFAGLLDAVRAVSGLAERAIERGRIDSLA